MNYIELEKQKIKIRLDIKNCKDSTEEKFLKSVLLDTEKKQMKLLKEKASLDERTGSFI